MYDRLPERLSGLAWRLDHRRVRGELLARRAAHVGFDFAAERGVRVGGPGKNTRLRIGDQVYLFRDVLLSLDGDGAVLDIGDRTQINRRTEVIAMEHVTIGADVMVSWDVLITDTDYHRVDGATATAPVTIEDLAWVGTRATILKGVTVGRGAVVAAGSIVTRDVAPHTLVAGSPARVIREGVTWGA